MMQQGNNKESERRISVDQLSVKDTQIKRTPERRPFVVPSIMIQATIAIGHNAKIPEHEATVFNCKTNAQRDPRESKGLDYDLTQLADNSCAGGDSCC